MILAVTGAAGSIGSSLVRAACECGDYSAVRAIDLNESGLHTLASHSPLIRTIVADVGDQRAMEDALDGVGAIAHCAALKHVGMCEYNPGPAIRTNVLGTENVIRCGEGAGVERFVLLSTDKASQPTSVMSATKLLAERMLPAFSAWCGMKMAAIRFGNVFFSRGSVLPVWLRALDRGEPIRLTSRDATRFSITIEQAIMSILMLLRRPIESGTTYTMAMRAYDIGTLADQFCQVVASKRPKQEVIGLQPGEKAHELAFSPDEAARARPDGEFWATNPHWLATGDHSEVPWSSEHVNRIELDDLRRMVERYCRDS